MKILKILSSAVLVTAGLAALGASANAAAIPVADPYFNMFPTVPTIFAPNGIPQQTVGTTADTYLIFKFCGPGCQFADDNIVGWTASDTFNSSKAAVAGQYQIGTLPSSRFKTDPMIDAKTPEPIVVREQNATISQVVSTKAVAGVTYTLNVDMGFPTDQGDYGQVQLIVGNEKPVIATPLASDGLAEKAMELTGNWYDFQATYTATAADAGAPIDINLWSLNHGQGFSYFGDVRLTDSFAVADPPGAPEPATWAMMLLGFGGMAGIAAFRRSSGRRSAVGQVA
jgi:hypothetical protein